MKIAGSKSLVTCPGTETLTVESLGLGEEAAVTFAIWEHDDLIRPERLVLPDEILTYHWQTDQLSLFICYAYFGTEIKSFVVVSDEITHDSTLMLSIINREICKFLSVRTFEFTRVHYKWGCWTFQKSVSTVRTIQDKIHYSINDFQVAQFVVHVYNQNWWMEQITYISIELLDITVSFMHPQEESGKKKDEFPGPLGNVSLTVRNPTLLGPPARLHTFDKVELIKIHQIYCR
ncbi:hypothetical protein PR048_030702 [Dryococelus australis]|uniref:Uncharacterized protein n=1 Tax=Dryococelus australis TaxID=614101 RepID=A0ABQ9G9N4_9NEOP|nr:hypothetical protein PR048_030702 [Dryococelus australis]